MALRLPRSLAAAAALVLCPLNLPTSSGDETVPPTAHPYGASYEEWTARWWQWNLARWQADELLRQRPYVDPDPYIVGDETCERLESER